MTRYEIWILGYDKDQKAVDFEYPLDLGISSPITATKHFEKFQDTVQDIINNECADKLNGVHYINMILEKVVVDSCVDILQEQRVWSR